MPKNSGGAGADIDIDVLNKENKTNKKLNLKKPTSYQGKETPIEIQAQIIGALLSGQFEFDNEIAKATGVSKATVTRIKRKIPHEYLKQLVPAKKDRVSELVVQFLETTLESLTAINAVTSTEEWIIRQDAPGLAIFFGVKADKVTKILEAIERANSQPEELESAVEQDS